MSEEELLNWLDNNRMILDAIGQWNWESGGVDQEAFQQIKALIQKKPEVDEEFIEKWTESIYCDRKSMRSIKRNLFDMLEEVGVRIK